MINAKLLAVTQVKNPHDLIKSNYRALHFLFLCESNDSLATTVTEFETKAPSFAGPWGEISGGKGGGELMLNIIGCLSLPTGLHPTDRNAGENSGSCDGIVSVFIFVGNFILRPTGPTGVTGDC